jgi:hypothetical protein
MNEIHLTDAGFAASATEYIRKNPSTVKAFTDLIRNELYQLYANESVSRDTKAQKLTEFCNLLEVAGNTLPLSDPARLALTHERSMKSAKYFDIIDGVDLSIDSWNIFIPSMFERIITGREIEIDEMIRANNTQMFRQIKSKIHDLENLFDNTTEMSNLVAKRSDAMYYWKNPEEDPEEGLAVRSEYLESSKTLEGKLDKQLRQYNTEIRAGAERKLDDATLWDFFRKMNNYWFNVLVHLKMEHTALTKHGCFVFDVFGRPTTLLDSFPKNLLNSLRGEFARAFDETPATKIFGKGLVASVAVPAAPTTGPFVHVAAPTTGPFVHVAAPTTGPFGPVAAPTTGPFGPVAAPTGLFGHVAAPTTGPFGPVAAPTGLFGHVAAPTTGLFGTVVAPTAATGPTSILTAPATATGVATSADAATDMTGVSMGSTSPVPSYPVLQFNMPEKAFRKLRKNPIDENDGSEVANIVAILRRTTFAH